MRLFKHTIWIARPRDAVFAFFVDFSQAPRWRAFVRSMEPVEPGPLRAGSRIRCHMDLLGEDHEFDLSVLVYEPPALWRHRTDEVDFNGYIEYRFDSENDGTRVTMSGEAKPISFYGWIAMPLMWLGRGKSYRDQLPQLKRAIEG
jgi:uncharacterized protein YndB with AHSA1/START domain